MLRQLCEYLTVWSHFSRLLRLLDFKEEEKSTTWTSSSLSSALLSSSTKSITHWFLFACSFLHSGRASPEKSPSPSIERSIVFGFVEWRWIWKFLNFPMPSADRDLPPLFNSLPKWNSLWWSLSTGPNSDDEIQSFNVFNVDESETSIFTLENSKETEFN